MQFKKADSFDVIKSSYLIGLLFVALFISALEYVLIPHIGISDLLGQILIFGVATPLVFLLNRKVYFDSITLFLFIRVFLYIIPYSYAEIRDNYWGNFVSVLCALFAYFIASQPHKSDLTKRIDKFIFGFFIILAVEILATAVLMIKTYGILGINSFKLYLVVPLGSSNTIACFVLPTFFYILYSSLSSKVKVFSSTITLLLLFIIQSKNAIIVLFGIGFVLLIVKGINKIKSISHRLYEKKTWIITLFVSIVLVGFYSVIRAFQFFLNKWKMSAASDNVSLYDILNSLSSGRLDVYLTEIKRWGKHLFFGNGVGYEIGYWRSHNWIIELLVQVGVIGFIVFVLALTVWFAKVWPYFKKNTLVKASSMFIIISLIQGLAEVSLFVALIDSFFWTLAGIAVSQVNYLTEKSQEHYIKVERESRHFNDN